MKRIQTVIVLLISLFILSSSKHPIKLTSSEIRFDKKIKTITLECKVFTDDFAKAFPDETLFSRIGKSKLTTTDLQQFEVYFNDKYKVMLNNVKQSLNYTSYEIKGNVMTLSFLIKNVELNKGDELLIENQLLFELFSYKQTNWILLKLPPFISNHNFPCKFKSYTYSHTF